MLTSCFCLVQYCFLYHYRSATCISCSLYFCSFATSLWWVKIIIIVNIFPGRVHPAPLHLYLLPTCKCDKFRTTPVYHVTTTCTCCGVDGICGSGQSDTVKNGGVENARVDTTAQCGKGGQCRSGQFGTTLQGWTLQEWSEVNKAVYKITRLAETLMSAGGQSYTRIFTVDQTHFACGRRMPLLQVQTLLGVHTDRWV